MSGTKDVAAAAEALRQPVQHRRPHAIASSAALRSPSLAAARAELFGWTNAPTASTLCCSGALDAAQRAQLVQDRQVRESDAASRFRSSPRRTSRGRARRRMTHGMRCTRTARWSALRQRQGLVAVLAAIDAGELEADDVDHAYLAGAVDVLARLTASSSAVPPAPAAPDEGEERPPDEHDEGGEVGER